MKTTALIIIIIIGLVLIGYSLTLEKFTNEEEYESKYRSITGDDDRSEQFFKLRDEYLTNKYEFENYGITALLVGLSFLFFSFRAWKKFKTPSTKFLISLTGFLAVITTIFGYVGELFFEYNRGSYPPWADSLGIPLSGVPVMFIMLLGWYLLNLIGLCGDFRTGVLVHGLRKNKINYWYAVVLILTLLITILAVVAGDFWSVVPGFLWSYFYLSLLMGRREAKIEMKIE